MNRLAVLTAAAALVMVSRGGATTPARVAIAMNDSSIELDRSVVPGGGVTLVVSNTGHQVHELAIVPAAGAREPIAGVARITGGTTREATYDLRPGRYMVLCNQPEHSQQGLRAALEVNWP